MPVTFSVGRQRECAKITRSIRFASFLPMICGRLPGRCSCLPKSRSLSMFSGVSRSGVERNSNFSKSRCRSSVLTNGGNAGVFHACFEELYRQFLSWFRIVILSERGCPKRDPNRPVRIVPHEPTRHRSRSSFCGPAHPCENADLTDRLRGRR
jgi:hypothetical protein